MVTILDQGDLAKTGDLNVVRQFLRDQNLDWNLWRARREFAEDVKALEASLTHYLPHRRGIRKN